MSRIGLTPIQVSKEVNVSIADDMVVVKGPKGELSLNYPSVISIKAEGDTLLVTRRRNDKTSKAMHGLTRSLLNNNIIGVEKGWQKELELKGVGYRAKLDGNDLILSLGFSHPIVMTSPEGISFEVKKERIIVSGIDRQLVGQVAAKIRAYKKPEPYKGKGIRYVGEHVRKKAGKSAKAVGGGPGAS